MMGVRENRDTLHAEFALNARLLARARARVSSHTLRCANASCTCIGCEADAQAHRHRCCCVCEWMRECLCFSLLRAGHDGMMRHTNVSVVRRIVHLILTTSSAVRDRAPHDQINFEPPPCVMWGLR